MDYESHYLREILETQERILHELRAIKHELAHPTPTATRFTEITMNPTAAGQSQVFTGTFVPAGSVPPTDAVYAVTSNDTVVSPSMDSTGLIVSVTYPAGWVESTTTPLAFTRTASSASVPWTLSDIITPSAPAVGVPTNGPAPQCCRGAASGR